MAFHGGWHNYTDNVFDKFGSCEAVTCASNAECCFFDEGHLMKGWFCMTNAQKKGNHIGKYIDFEGTSWKYRC